MIVSQGTVSQFFWDHYVAARGLDQISIEIINATSDAQSLLATGDADAYVMMPSSDKEVPCISNRGLPYLMEKSE